ARTFVPGAGRSLADCAAALGIDLANAHRASADALATAQLLSAYLGLDPEDSLWQEPLDRAGHVQWPSLMPTNVGWMSRPDSPEKQMPFLERITEKIAEFAGASEQLDYLALLDRCLVDRVVSSHEADALVAIAEELGIGRSTCATLHNRYFDTLVDIAWSDGILTDAEILDLLVVADLLDIGTDVVAAAMEPRAATQVMVAASTLFALCHGDRIVLTGEMSRPRAEWHGILTSRGYEPWPAVTKHVAIVVAADVDSLSGKARKAKDYGIPVVTEEWLESQIRG
ncbi:MAG: polymerase subunit epsilon, partial [Glaciihabitans sp.]|nr:polymerase subunit epsilon [Glaciihabitans sp.]